MAEWFSSGFCVKYGMFRARISVWINLTFGKRLVTASTSMKLGVLPWIYDGEGPATTNYTVRRSA